MYMTRDTDSNMIKFWYERADFCYIDGSYDIKKSNWLLKLNKYIFKQWFPNHKLPRKGSCKYVELRLYIPGEG